MIIRCRSESTFSLHIAAYLCERSDFPALQRYAANGLRTAAYRTAAYRCIFSKYAAICSENPKIFCSEKRSTNRCIFSLKLNTHQCNLHVFEILFYKQPIFLLEINTQFYSCYHDAFYDYFRMLCMFGPWLS